jgi:uncharacterized membrane protein
MKTKHLRTDRQIELIIAGLLQGGVLLAALVVFIGGVMYLVHYGAAYPDYRVFRGEPAKLRNLAGIIADASTFHSRGIIQLGLLILIATPVMRVAFSVMAFLQQRDHLYVLVTSIVLLLLLFSLAGGIS